MAEKISYPKAVSPRGVAVYPWLVEADTKFGAPTYKTALRVTVPEAQPYIEVIEGHLRDIATGVTKLLREDEAKRMHAGIKAKKLKSADKPYVEETDEEGNPTGFVLFKFKASGEFKNKQGEMQKRFVKFIDAGKNPAFPSAVWGGSELKIRAELRPWVNAKSEYGVKLGIDLVQILKLVAGGGSADTSGFDEEEGYTAPPKSSTKPSAEPSEPHADSGDGDF